MTIQINQAGNAIPFKSFDFSGGEVQVRIDETALLGRNYMVTIRAHLRSPMTSWSSFL